MTGTSIELEDLTVGYNGGAVLRAVSGRFPAGELSAVVGPNGCGKSTLLKTITGLLHPRSGRVRFTGTGRPDYAYLPQQSDIDADFPVSVREVVTMGLWPRIGGFGRVTAEYSAEVEAALGAVGLASFADRPMGELSGGQTRRALFARIVVQDAPVILLDEPFGNIDSHTTAALIRMMEGWRKEGRIVVAVLHDLDIAQRFFRWTMLLAHQSVACGPTADVLTPDNLVHARDLCDACAADRGFWAAA